MSDTGYLAMDVTIGMAIGFLLATVIALAKPDGNWTLTVCEDTPGMRLEYVEAAIRYVQIWPSPELAERDAEIQQRRFQGWPFRKPYHCYASNRIKGNTIFWAPEGTAGEPE